MFRKLSYFLLLASALVIVDGCSQHARQMRQTRKLSRQNTKRANDKKANETFYGPGEIPKDDPNYKPYAVGPGRKAKHQGRHLCVYVNKRGKRCTRLAKRRSRYCWWHTLTLKKY